MYRDQWSTTEHVCPLQWSIAIKRTDILKSIYMSAVLRRDRTRVWAEFDTVAAVVAFCRRRHTHIQPPVHV